MLNDGSCGANREFLNMEAFFANVERSRAAASCTSGRLDVTGRVRCWYCDRLGLRWSEVVSSSSKLYSDAPLEYTDEALEYIDAESVEKTDKESLEYDDEVLDCVSSNARSSKVSTFASYGLSSTVDCDDAFRSYDGRGDSVGSSSTRLDVARQSSSRSEYVGAASTFIVRSGDVVDRARLRCPATAKDPVGMPKSNFRSSADLSLGRFELFVARGGSHVNPTIFISDVFCDTNVDFDGPALQSVFLRVNFMTIDVGAEASLAACFAGLTL